MECQMTKLLQDIILGAEFQAAAIEAVAEAVRQADAAGLPKAYEPDFSLNRQLEGNPSAEKPTDGAK
jgi:hypothetical protein